MIRRVRAEDAGAVSAIYNYYVIHTVVTFEEAPVSVPVMEGRIREISAAYPWLVWEEDGEILGYAYINKWRDRTAYRFSAEDTIYLKNGCQGRGLGKTLLAALIDEVKKGDIRAIMAGITIPNAESVGLHERFGFKKAAHFTRIGWKMDRWLDVGYWELMLEGRP